MSPDLTFLPGDLVQLRSFDLSAVGRPIILINVVFEVGYGPQRWLTLQSNGSLTRLTLNRMDQLLSRTSGDH